MGSARPHYTNCNCTNLGTGHLRHLPSDNVFTVFTEPVCDIQCVSHGTTSELVAIQALQNLQNSDFNTHRFTATPETVDPLADAINQYTPSTPLP